MSLRLKDAPTCRKFGDLIGNVDVETCNVNCSPAQSKECFDLWVEFESKRDIFRLKRVNRG